MSTTRKEADDRAAVDAWCPKAGNLLRTAEHGGWRVYLEVERDPAGKPREIRLELYTAVRARQLWTLDAILAWERTAAGYWKLTPQSADDYSYRVRLWLREFRSEGRARCTFPTLAELTSYVADPVRYARELERRAR